MPEQIRSDNVLPAGSVRDVHPETGWERAARVLPVIIRLFSASIFLVAAMIVIVCIMFSVNPALDHYRSGAWGLFSALVGGCAAYLFGEFRADRT